MGLQFFQKNHSIEQNWVLHWCFEGWMFEVLMNAAHQIGKGDEVNHVMLLLIPCLFTYTMFLDADFAKVRDCKLCADCKGIDNIAKVSNECDTWPQGQTENSFHIIASCLYWVSLYSLCIQTWYNSEES